MSGFEMETRICTYLQIYAYRPTSQDPDSYVTPLIPTLFAYSHTSKICKQPNIYTFQAVSHSDRFCTTASSAQRVGGRRRAGW